MAVSAATVATSIAALSVSGLTIKDLDAIPQEVTARDCPVMFPDPSRFLTDLSIEVDSYGSAAAKKTVRYTLNYILAYRVVGEERGLYKIYQGFVQKVCLLLDAMLANDALSGCIDSTPTGLTLGVVQDPAGKSFHGCLIPIRIMEFYN